MRFIGIAILSVFVVSCSVRKNQQAQITAIPKTDTVIPQLFENNNKKQYHSTPTQFTDITHIELHISFDWQKHIAFGDEKLFFHPFAYALDSFFFDAKDMQLRAMELLVNQIPVDIKTYYDKQMLGIKSSKIIQPGDQCVLSIRYTAFPDSNTATGSAAIRDAKGLYFINTDKKRPNIPTQLWTQGETESNSHWIICTDKPFEKATYDLYIYAEPTQTVLSNGRFVDKVKNNDGSIIHHWKNENEMSAYLLMMTIGNFEITKDQWRDKEVNYYLQPEFHPFAKEIFRNTPEMIEFFSKTLSYDFPWEKYAQVVVHDYVSGAMENTSATLHGSFVQKNTRQLIGNDNDDIIAHELFHQWFGDLVTCKSWSHITLNEGFATFGEQLWRRYKYGAESEYEKIFRSMQSYLNFSKINDEPLINYEYNDKENLFNAISYQKGGRILNLLKFTLGEDVFFKGIKKYLHDFAFKAAQADDLRLCMEQVSGKDLRPFFQQWYFQGGHPQIELSYRFVNDSLEINVMQIQSGNVFEFPLQFRIVENGISTLFTEQIQLRNQNFYYNIKNKENYAIFPDPNCIFIGHIFEKDLQKRACEKLSLAQNYIEKMRSMQVLKLDTGLHGNNACLIQMIDDSNPLISLNAMQYIDWNGKMLKDQKVRLQRIATLSSNPAQKSQAIFLLAKLNDQTLLNDFLNWTEEASYNVAGAALYAVNTIKKDMAYKKAKELEKDCEDELLRQIATIFSEQKNVADSAFFLQHIYHSNNAQAKFVLQKFALWAKMNSTSHIFEHEIFKLYDINEGLRANIIESLWIYNDKNFDDALGKKIQNLIDNTKDEDVLNYLKWKSIIR